MSKIKLVADTISRQKKMESDRSNYPSYWQDLAEFSLPRKAYVSRSRTPGERLQLHRVFDGTAIRSLQTMASGFSSHLTNPNSNWFSLATRDRELMKLKNVKVWFKQVETEIFSTLASTNFDETMQEFYLDAGCFGTGVIFIEEDPKAMVRFKTIPIKEVFIEEDAQGRVNRLIRKFEYSAQQAWDLWGDNAGLVVSKAMKDKEFSKKITFMHSVQPRDRRQAGKIDNLNMPFESLWIEVSKQHLIKEGGFKEFPYAVGRFNKLTGEVWGFSPTMTAFADIGMINNEKATLIRAAMKIVDPAVLLPSRGFIMPLNFNPGGANYYKSGRSPEDMKFVDTKGNIPVGMEMILDVKHDIEDTYFVKLFNTFAQITKQMTIPEVQARIAENMVLLGPVVGRFTQEVLSPEILRTYSILQRAGKLPPPPEEIVDQDLDIIFISALARAQRMPEINSLERTLTAVGGMAELFPGVLDKVDSDKAVDLIAEINGTNPEIIRSDDEVAEIREAQAEAAAQQQQLDTLQQGADIAKVASEAEKNAGATV